MSSSYQPVAVGVPVSQNPYPSVPYSQNFPNEPDTDSHPLNNQSQHYYPPNYGQQPLITNQSGPAYGSNQQPQFLMVPIDPESNRLNMKISEIDKTLKSGCYFCYMVYLYLEIISATIATFRHLISLFACATFDHTFQGSRAIILIVAALIFISSNAWALQCTFVFKNAMNDRNLKGAKRGLQSMTWQSVYCLIITFGMIVAFKYGIKILPSDLQEEYSKVPAAPIVAISSTSLFFLLFGAQKVTDLLTEREKLVQEMNTRFGTNLT